MSVIGIVGEYNPFHYGHKYHIDETKKLLGEDAPVVCVMSGDFIQRGEAAVYSKFARAEAAVKCGADLVLELPVPWALSSAEGFAEGAVGILGNIGVVTHLSFGSECGEIEPLEKIAQLLIDPLMTGEIKDELAKDDTLSFASARQRAVFNRIGESARLLETPNNILAVEYIKAIYNQSLGLEPVTLRRIGSGHDKTGENGPRSASELRTRLARGMDISDSVPETAMEIYAREDSLGRGPVMMENLELPLMSRLRMLSDEDFSGIPDGGAGLANRLAAACREESGLDAVAAAAKSKRYALSRIRRMLMCAALGIKAEDTQGIPPYARVLAANERGCALLKEMNVKSRIPVLTKPASVKDMGMECKRIFELGARVHDLYVLGYTAREERRGGADWRNSPKIVNK
ncbi:MAG: nucleotidyltransferase family protein [Bacillota bacterium]|nr:nucleotidyltransferase family protein [Bacillota bacterium]